MRQKNFIAGLCMFSILFLSGCNQEAESVKEKTENKIDTEQKEIHKAKALINPTKNNTAKGEVVFTAGPDGIHVVARIEGLKPGKHGFHVHEKGDCSAPDGSSAGDHFNPKHTRHGSPEEAERHAGDLGNVVANDSGIAEYDRIDTVLKLNGPDSIVGRSVVIHADPDDFSTQPTGNSGGRIGCGVIEAIE